MTLKEKVKNLVATKDLVAIGSFIDQLRIQGFAGILFDYASIQLLFQRCAGLDADDFEMLMLEVDAV